MKNLHLKLVPLGIALLVAGCGGGASSSSGSTAIPTGAVKITNANAQKVAIGANSSTSTLTTASNATAPATPTGVVVGTSSSSLSVMSSALNGFNAVRNLKFPAVATGAAGAPVTAPLRTCATGSGTASWTDTNSNGTLDAGDILSVTYTNCVDQTDSIKRNGRASFTFSASSFSLAYTGYSEVIPSPAETLAMDGDMTLSLTSLSATNIQVSMSGTSIETNSSLDGHFKMWAPTNGSGYSMVITLDSSNNAYTYAVNMSVASTEMGGSVSIVTSPAFSGTGLVNPDLGTMTITGASGSNMTISAYDATHYSVSGTDGSTSFGPTQYLW